jgi:POT family proton-dependent oligopeptide transporter
MIESFYVRFYMVINVGAMAGCMIHSEYARSGDRINVLWQAPSYILFGAGEIFSISTAYEVAFPASPPNKKAFACKFNLFCIGGIPNMLSLGLYCICELVI